MSLAQIERIRDDIAQENAGDVQTPTKWWIVGVPEENLPRAGFVENADKVIDEAAVAA